MNQAALSLQKPGRILMCQREFDATCFIEIMHVWKLAEMSTYQLNVIKTKRQTEEGVPWKGTNGAHVPHLYLKA